MRNARKTPGIAVAAWDVAWRIVAIRRAVLNHQWKWVLPLATVSSAGLLPLLYLWRFASPEEDAGAATSPAQPEGGATGAS